MSKECQYWNKIRPWRITRRGRGERNRKSPLLLQPNKDRHFEMYFFYTSTVHSLLFRNLTDDCTTISKTITNNMLLHVSTFKMPSSGSPLCLTKITYRFLGLGKIKLLKFIILYFNNFILPRLRYLYVILVGRNDLPEDDILNVKTSRSMLFVIIAFDQRLHNYIKRNNYK